MASHTNYIPIPTTDTSLSPEHNRDIPDEPPPAYHSHPDFFPLLRNHLSTPTYKRLPRILLTITLLLLLVVVFFWRLFAHGYIGSDNTDPRHPSLPKRPFQEFDVESHLLRSVNKERMKESLKTLAKRPHTAGDSESAEWIEGIFRKIGLEQVQKEEFWPLLCWPKERRLRILEADKIRWEATLREDVIEEDKFSGKYRDAVPTFNAYGADGEATAELVYANYGRVEDFEILEKNNISVKDRIVLVRYGQNMRGVKVREAELRGAAGVLITSDPRDDGADRGSVYPEGPWRPPTSVERGTVDYIPLYAGDPLTPNYPAYYSAPRLNRSEAMSLPKILALPISHADTNPLYEILEGKKPEGWNYPIGPSMLKVELIVKSDWSIKPIWNIFGEVTGWEEPDQIIVVGGHRDAWAGGAVDPSSGQAILLEAARLFGSLLKGGWRPRRTVRFASWDGEEYALIGSTEHIESLVQSTGNQTNLNLVAYINVDTAVFGADFTASAVPSLHHLLWQISRRVDWSQNPSLSVYDAWKNNDGAEVGILGSGSDYTAFLHYAGVASLDIASGQSNYGVYHSNYDSFHWMEKFGDSDFRNHEMMARIIVLLTHSLSSEPTLGFNLTHYAATLQKYIADLSDYIAVRNLTEKLPLEDLRAAAADLEVRTLGFDLLRVRVEHEYELAGYSGEDPKMWWRRKWLNGRMARMERGFLVNKGLPFRPWYKHVLFAPGLHTGYSAETFPPIRDLIEVADFVQARAWTREIVRMVGRISDHLVRTEFE